MGRYRYRRGDTDPCIFSPKEGSGNLAFGTNVSTVSNPAAFNDFQPSVIGVELPRGVIIRYPCNVPEEPCHVLDSAERRPTSISSKIGSHPETCLGSFLVPPDLETYRPLFCSQFCSHSHGIAFPRESTCM